MDICHWFSSHLHKRQEVELLCASPQMDTIQKVQGTGNLGQGVYQYKGFESNISYLQRVSLTLMKNLSYVCEFYIWEQIPSEQTESLPDPFNDITCGGWEITEEPRGCLALWAVSLQGKVRTQFIPGLHTVPCPTTPHALVIYSFFSSIQSVWIIGSWNTDTILHHVHLFSKRGPKRFFFFFFTFEQVWFRCGINNHNPEGSYWEEVSVPGEVVQISCGPGDLVWAVLWEGHLLVREGIGRDCLRGERSGAVHSLLPSYHFLDLKFFCWVDKVFISPVYIL